MIYHNMRRKILSKPTKKMTRLTRSSNWWIRSNPKTKFIIWRRIQAGGAGRHSSSPRQWRTNQTEQRRNKVQLTAWPTNSQLCSFKNPSHYVSELHKIRDVGALNLWQGWSFEQSRLSWLSVHKKHSEKDMQRDLLARLSEGRSDTE